MAILQEVLEMQKRGMNDIEIVRALQERGISSQEINDALNQAKVKQVVNEGISGMPQNMEAGGVEKMQPSMLQPSSDESFASVMPIQTSFPKHTAREKPAEEELVVPSPIPASPVSKMPQTPKTPYAPSTEEYPSYPAAEFPSPASYDYTGYGGSMDTETVEEIAEEIVSEKFQEFRRKVGDISDFKSDTELRLNQLGERLKRIEDSIDKIQAALIGKVQEYGKDVRNLGSEMKALQAAFSKILDPFVGNIKELDKIVSKLRTSRGSYSSKKLKAIEKKISPVVRKIKKGKTRKKK